MNISDLNTFVIKAREAGKSIDEILEQANAEGYKTSRGTKLSKLFLYALVTRLKRKGLLSGMRRGPTAKTKKAKIRPQTQMLTIPIDETPKSTGKVMTMIADVETTERLIGQFLRGAA